MQQSASTNIVRVLRDIDSELDHLECVLSRASSDTDEEHDFIVGVGLFFDQTKDGVDRLINEGIKLIPEINEEAA